MLNLNPQYVLFEFNQWKKDEGDKANGLMSLTNDAIIWTEARILSHC